MKQGLLPFCDRVAAGRALAAALEHYRNRNDVLVLALPRGGVPVAAEVAAALGAGLDLIIVRKLGAPGHEELAMGAIASGGVRVLNPHVISSLGIRDTAIEEVAKREQRELERREHAYRGARPRPVIEGRCLILVDDGVATGATMRAAIEALRRQSPAKIVVAVPVAPPDTVKRLRSEADEVICLEAPELFMAIGQFYVEFTQLSDEAVREQLANAWATLAGPSLARGRVDSSA
ncbi:MAG: phosphoribosyltransferase family protein [Betaproteobacteria bacterium]|nr:phosphoribosyltransferase family protein [Betaproteobacteria bacterium]MDH3437769.1 phosphoribosyltransferase family protein [Betaproteobacteria bacterium]